MAEKLFHQEGEEVREYTAAEYAQNAKDLAAYEASLAKISQDQAKRETLLAKLGITAEEAELLLSPKPTVINNA